MGKILVNESSLSGIAEAIRSKNGESTTYKPGQMAAAIQAIPSTSTLGTKSITANGSYAASGDNLDGYSSVSVDVPNSYAAGDEGKVVSNGALVAQTARSSEITSNGTYDTTVNDEVTVNVSSGGGGAIILKGTTAPDPAQGNNGVVYLRYGEYTYTSFMDGKIIIRENSVDSTDIKLFVVGLQKTTSDITITDPTLNEYFSDITSGYLKGCDAYDTSTSTTQSSIFSIGYTNDGGHKIATYSIGWSQFKAGTFYGMIDLNEPPTQTGVNPVYQHNGNVQVDTSQSSPIVGSYLKANGAWQDLIGSDVDDVNTSLGNHYYKITEYNYVGNIVLREEYIQSGNSITIQNGYSLTPNGTIVYSPIQVLNNLTIYVTYPAEYHQSADGKLGVLVFSNYVVWFFNGFVKASTNDILTVELDENVRPYVPNSSGFYVTRAYDTNNSTNYFANIGFYDNGSKIRTWTPNQTSLTSGTFWATLEIPMQTGTPYDAIDRVNIQRVPYIAPESYRI